MKKVLLCLLLITLSVALIFRNVPHAEAVLSSSNVLVVLTPTMVGSWPSYASVHGGTLPTLDPAFSGFTFSVIGFPSLSAAAIGGNDTVVLVVSYTTDISGLTSSQKTLLNDFVYNGGKLIIYDSETTPSVDYSWLVYPMTTKNPGAMGYSIAPIIFVENNTLGSTDPLSPYYIDVTTAPTGAWSDYVGDCNTFISADPNWCGDIKAQNWYSDPNSPGYDGSAANWTHTYARYGDGILIYNGFDIDPMSSNTVPSSTGRGNCAKIWLMELQQPWGDDWNLPCGVRVVGITLAPLSDTNLVGTTHTVTATVTDDLANPVPGVNVTFQVIEGPHVGTTGADTTDANGEATFSYTGTTAGTDTIRASFYCSVAQQTIYSNNVTKIWEAIPPVACFTVSNERPNVCETVTFDASCSYDPDGVIVKYEWDWEGDCIYDFDAGDDPIATHHYDVHGTYYPKLRVTDNNGLTNETQTTILVRGHPVASFTYSPPDPGTCETITFNASASTPDGGTLTSYAWNWDDGNTDTTSNPIITHHYSIHGTYNVTLTVFDSEDKNGTTWQLVNVTTHDVAVVDVTPESDWLYQGKLCRANINVTVCNEGDVPETFNVTLYYNITAGEIIGTQTVIDLPPGNCTTLTFLWDTTGVTPCRNYTITAVADVVPHETDTADNTRESPTKVKVRLLGDVDGNGKVNIQDLAAAGRAFGSYPGHPRWEVEADINNDGRVNIRDLAIIARNYGTCL